jgi:hypothetical protein
MDTLYTKYLLKLPFYDTFRFASGPAYFQQWMFDMLAHLLPQQVENHLDDTHSHCKDHCWGMVLRLGLPSGFTTGCVL